MSMAWAVFVLAIVAWGALRAAIPLTEWQRRSFWILAAATFAIPTFAGWDARVFVQQALWPMAAGLMVGELLWNRLRQRILWLNPSEPTATPESPSQDP